MPSRKSGEFTEGATLETIVPHASEVKLVDEVSSGLDVEGHGYTLSLSKISQRQRLYFDETVPVYILLRSPYLEETVLKSYLSRVTISVEAYAISTPTETHPSIDEDQPAPSTPQATRDLLWSSNAENFEEPLVVVQGGSEDDPEKPNHVFAIWKVDVPLRRPRIRAQKQDVSITATAYFKAAEHTVLDSKEQEPEDAEEEGYLPSGTPISSLNLLQALQSDPLLTSAHPTLSASRVSRIVPTKQSPIGPSLRPLRSSTKSIRFVPAISARVRYSRVVSRCSGGDQPGLIASLDIEVISQLDVVLTSVTLAPGGGTVEDLTDHHGIRLPLRCAPRDVVTLLYRLTPDRTFDHRSNGKTPHHQTPGLRGLDIAVSATGLVSQTCRPTLSMTWKAALDFSATVNPSFGGPSPSLQRARRPSSLPFPSASRTSSPSGSISHATDTPPNANSNNDPFGITITFTGPPTVRVGSLFTWQVLIVNRSSRHRKLSLVVLSDRRKAEVKIPNFTPVFSGGGGGGGPRSPSVAASAATEAFVDPNIVHGLQRSKRTGTEPADVVCLSTDLRVGPLAPAACHSTCLTFLAVGLGALHVDAIKVTDLASQDSVEVVDLPTIVGLRRQD